MPNLQGATVSNQVVRGRKRKRTEPDVPETNAPDDVATNDDSVHDASQPATSTSVPTKTHDGGQKPRRTPKKGDKPALKRKSSSTLVESSIPWPKSLTKLAQTHKALNLVYTFCCTRKQLATTFETIKSAVEANIKRELTIEDVARIKLLVPQIINFQYVDEHMLQVTLMGEENIMKGGRAKDFFPMNFRKENNIGEGSATGPPEEKGEVLLFEYIDGDLKRQVQDSKTGEPTKATRKLRQEDLKMPVYSQKQMMNLIEKRNTKFTSAVNAWLNDCAEQGVDPVERLEGEYKAFVPIPESSRNGTPAPDAAKDTLPKVIPTERESIPEIVNQLKTSEWYTGQIVPDGHRVFDPQEAVYGDLSFSLSQDLVNALYNTRNIQQLYSHQTEAINALHEGRNVIISTSTSSGKSLIYQIPVLNALEEDRHTRAMYIFPTKALAQDQRRSLKEMFGYLPGLADLVCDTFDGDTPMSERNYIRDEARVIFTNPDMLHLSILPQEEKWRTFLKNLKYVVVDELHVYNGLFGAHVALIMRRLRRICAAVGNRKVQFISCSATVANPEEHMKTIFGLDHTIQRPQRSFERSW
jgi:DEAD/DEAH box helicase domain-containing protein